MYIYSEKKIILVIQISEGNNSQKTSKKEKKSFWFEYAEKKGVDLGSWPSSKKKDEKNKKQKETPRFCTECGNTLKSEAMFCERCGERLRNKQ